MISVTEIWLQIWYHATMTSWWLLMTTTARPVVIASQLGVTAAQSRMFVTQHSSPSILTHFTHSYRITNTNYNWKLVNDCFCTIDRIRRLRLLLLLLPLLLLLLMLILHGNTNVTDRTNGIADVTVVRPARGANVYHGGVADHLLNSWMMHRDCRECLLSVYFTLVVNDELTFT